MRLGDSMVDFKSKKNQTSSISFVDLLIKKKKMQKKNNFWNLNANHLFMPNKFKQSTFTFVLCLKSKVHKDFNLKVPKYIIFEILKYSLYDKLENIFAQSFQEMITEKRFGILKSLYHSRYENKKKGMEKIKINIEKYFNENFFPMLVSHYNQTKISSEYYISFCEELIEFHFKISEMIEKSFNNHHQVKMTCKVTLSKMLNLDPKDLMEEGNLKKKPNLKLDRVFTHYCQNFLFNENNKMNDTQVERISDFISYFVYCFISTDVFFELMRKIIIKKILSYGNIIKREEIFCNSLTKQFGLTMTRNIYLPLNNFQKTQLEIHSTNSFDFSVRLLKKAYVDQIFPLNNLKYYPKRDPSFDYYCDCYLKVKIYTFVSF